MTQCAECRMDIPDKDVRPDSLQAASAPTCRGCRFYNRFILMIVLLFFGAVDIVVVAGGIFLVRLISS